MANVADALLITCMDFRLHPTIVHELPHRLGLRKFNFVGAAGVAKNFLEDGPAKEFLFDQIGKSIKLHLIGNVVLANHCDCGAYGGSFDGERDKHAEDMKAAAAVIKRKFPQLKVISVLVGMDKAGGRWNLDYEVLDQAG